MSLKVLSQYLNNKALALPPHGRYVLGITGCPGAGKSTLSQKLVDAVNADIRDEIAVIVPMDGYHLADKLLIERGLLALKGIPETFDATGFVQLLSKLRYEIGKSIYAPRFDRSIEASVADDIVIKPSHRICIVEGNYLLLQSQPWIQIAQYLDEVWFIDVPIKVLEDRLQVRHEAAGKTKDQATQKVFETDLPNANLVNATRVHADRLLENHMA